MAVPGETQEGHKVPRVGQAWFHAWDRSSPSGETDRQARGMRAFGCLLERQLPFKRIKTAVGSFMLPLGACLTLSSGAFQAWPSESLKYLTLSVSRI